METTMVRWKSNPNICNVGSNGYVWGVNTKIREGFYGRQVTAPLKRNVPVILAHTCFSTGYVGNKLVSNPVETIYNFHRCSQVQVLTTMPQDIMAAIRERK